MMASYPNCSSSISSIQSKQFDFVIAGGGTAGLVLACRLSEDPNVRVLVVEAGAERLNDPQILTPGLMGSLYGDPKYDWDYLSEPQAHLNNRQIGQPRGRVLGGSSAINFSLVLYPSKRDLDSWASLGNQGWNFKDMEPYYRKISTAYPPSEKTRDFLSLDNVDKAPIGKGPLQVSFGDEYTPTNKAWLDTFDSLGYRMKDDPTKGSGLGALANPASIDPKLKTRSYSANAYYTPEIAKRANLQILTEAHVEKVLLDNTSGSAVSATGVSLTTKDGNQHTVKANEEIILCAGALHSPKILELSGIGGKDLLESHEVPVIINNSNVGENLQDHALVSQSFEVNDGVPTSDLLRDSDILNSVMAQYQTTKEGPMGASTIASAYMPLVDATGPTDPDELRKLVDSNLNSYDEFPAREKQYKLLRETLQNPTEASAQHILLPSQININPEGPTTTLEMLNPVSPGNYLTLMTVLNRPFSRGHCHIKSANTKEKVIYDPRFCSHPLDTEILARHVQFIEKLIETEPLASIFKKDGRRLPALTASRSDLESAREIVRQRGGTVFHISGTCAMLPREEGGVVNDRLTVHGTKNLRVVDSSIFPLVPVGNIQTSVYAVAEKAADMIKEDNEKKTGGKLLGMIMRLGQRLKSTLGMGM